MHASLENLSSVLLIADASDSAMPYWAETLALINQLLQAFPEESVGKVHLLGCPHLLSRKTISSVVLPDKRSPSLIGPIVALLRKNRQYAQIGIIVGSGEIFDLEDHLTSPWVNRWALVKVNGDTLKPPTLDVPEFEADNLDGLLSWMESSPNSLPVAPRHIYSTWSNGKQQVDFDRTGYPLVFIEPLQAWVHLFPVTKPQFEAFLADFCLYGDSWYQQVLSINPRRSYRCRDLSRYEELFLTGILADEAITFAQWLGPNFRLPTPAEWREVYRWMEQQSTISLPIDADRTGLAESAFEIWQGLLRQLNPESLVKQSLMEYGVIEWLAEAGGIFCGLGHPRPSFKQILIDPLTDDPWRPIKPSLRLRHYGFRLLREVI